MQLVNTVRYPLDHLESAAGLAFIQGCAKSFGENRALVLPGFLTADSVASIAAEVSSRSDQAFSRAIAKSSACE